MNLSKLYENRFLHDDFQRNSIWKVLCKFFQKFVPENSVVLDIAAGRCEFINNIKAAKKFAVDINADIKNYAASDVVSINCNCFELLDKLEGQKADVIFISNFFEHLNSKDDVVNVLNLCREILNQGGKIIILQPNIKYVKGVYWDFIDHKLALTDLSLIEAGKICGYRITKVIKKFIPYTTKSNFPKAAVFVWIYLKLMPLSGWVFGSQSLIIMEK